MSAQCSLLIIGVCLSAMASETGAGTDPTSVQEAFDEKNRPAFEKLTANHQEFHLCAPWNYELPQNASRRYPLVVYIHGAGGASSVPDALTYLGAGSSQEASRFQQTYPSFVLASPDWTVDKVIEQIEMVKKQYRVDTDRLYLIGYSMGGSGSYRVANGYSKKKGNLFAGIIRLAGQSQTELGNTIASRTSIWMHIGLNDTPTRVKVIREAYAFLKKHLSRATESSSPIAIGDIRGTTVTLTLDGRDVVKKTEYDGVGHGVSTFPFKDPQLLRWLFDQSLERRR
jgi:predicted peptidase